VILCDLMMPDMTGMDLHADLVRRDPRVAERMVFLTGGAFTGDARRFLDEVPNARLEKPFDVGALRAAVRQREREHAAAA
jgi:CheY-like chemotaxis protein